MFSTPDHLAGGYVCRRSADFAILLRPMKSLVTTELHDERTCYDSEITDHRLRGGPAVGRLRPAAAAGSSSSAAACPGDIIHGVLRLGSVGPVRSGPEHHPAGGQCL